MGLDKDLRELLREYKMRDDMSYVEYERKRRELVPRGELTSMWLTRRDSETGKPIQDMAIVPSEDTILVRQMETPNITESGIVTSTQNQKEFYGVITAIGRQVFTDDAYHLGDFVVLNPIGSVPITLGEDQDKKPQQYLAVTSEDILAVLEVDETRAGSVPEPPHTQPETVAESPKA